MPGHGRKYAAARKAVATRLYNVGEAIATIRKAAYAKFDESLELAMSLGVDPKHADQMVRGTVSLPHGTGRNKRVLVIASGEKTREAEAAGADHVGGSDMVAKVQAGWIEFEAVIATPDMMKEVGKLGKVLGPRGLMPNPKTGTVTFDVSKAVTEIKAGKVEFRVDKTAIIHVAVGKLSFSDAKLADNAMAVITAVLRAKPAASKGKYLKSIYLSSTMGPSVPVDPDSVEAVTA